MSKKNNKNKNTKKSNKNNNIRKVQNKIKYYIENIIVKNTNCKLIFPFIFLGIFIIIFLLIILFICFIKNIIVTELYLFIIISIVIICLTITNIICFSCVMKKDSNEEINTFLFYSSLANTVKDDEK